jgi:hypothetical protein
MTWNRISEMGLVYDQQNINGKNDIMLWDDRKKMTEEDLDQALHGISQAAGGGGK